MITEYILDVFNDFSTYEIFKPYYFKSLGLNVTFEDFIGFQYNGTAVIYRFQKCIPESLSPALWVTTYIHSVLIRRANAMALSIFFRGTIRVG
jgi:hypothetical protein